MATTTGSTTRRRLWRWTADEIMAMLDAGILRSDSRTELLDGVLVKKMPKNPDHLAVQWLLNRFLTRIVPDGYSVCIEGTIEIPWPGRTRLGSLPEPDAVVLFGNLASYHRRIVPDDIALIIEVSDSSIARDRQRKKVRYARASIAVYWLINIPQRRIEVYTAPTGPGRSPDYRTMTVFAEDQEIALVLRGVEVGRIVVRDLLPSPQP